jgi:hypothetical protein
MQCAPLSSSIGFTDTGIESAHCHHAAASFLNASASTAACISASPVTGPIATIQRSIEGFMKPPGTLACICPASAWRLPPLECGCRLLDGISDRLLLSDERKLAEPVGFVGLTR